MQSVCGDGWLNLCTLITQCATGVQPHSAPESNQSDSGLGETALTSRQPHTQAPQPKLIMVRNPVSKCTKNILKSPDGVQCERSVCSQMCNLVLGGHHQTFSSGERFERWGGGRGQREDHIYTVYTYVNKETFGPLTDTPSYSLVCNVVG